MKTLKVEFQASANWWEILNGVLFFPPFPFPPFLPIEVVDSVFVFQELIFWLGTPSQINQI